MKTCSKRSIQQRSAVFFWLCFFAIAPAACAAPSPTPSGLQGSAMPTSQARRGAAAGVSVRLVERLEKSAGGASMGPLHYGDAIGLYGDTLAVGAPERTGMQGHQKGKVFIYQREGGSWTEAAQLVASDRDHPSQNDPHFGSSLALFGDTLMVGAPGADDGEGGNKAGAVYLFERRGEVWVETGILRASDQRADAGFGRLVKLREDILLVSGGYSGQAVYVFENQGGRWVERARLAGENMGEKDGFGLSLAIAENRLAVGAVDFDPEFDRYTTGGVYLFKREREGWVQETKLALVQQGWRGFGSSLDLEGQTLVVGEMSEEAGFMSGAVYIYEHGLEGWKQQARIVAGDGSYSAAFGSSVDLQGELLAVGSSLDSSQGLWSGSVYLFQRQGDAWLDLLKLWPGEEDYQGAFFGGSLQLSGNTLVVAAPAEFGNAVYVYEVAPDR